MTVSLKDQLHRTGHVIFTVRVRPQAKRSMFKKPLANGTLKIDLMAVAEDGQANAELVRFLAEEFGVAKTAVAIVSGEMARAKIVRIVILTPRPSPDGRGRCRSSKRG